MGKFSSLLHPDNFHPQNSLNVTYPGNLRAPVEERLRTDVGSIFAHVVKETAQGHELRDEHHLRRHTHREDAHAARVVHRRHHTRLLQ